MIRVIPMTRRDLRDVVIRGGAFLLLLIAAGLFPHVLSAQSDDAAPLEQLEPERVEAQVAPVEAALEGMPPLAGIPLEDLEVGTEVVIEPLPPAEVAPPEIPQDVVTPVAMIPGEEQIYFNATLGGGSTNSILGSINVYRLGEGPQFRVGYDHQGRDGFNFEAAGTGFFSQTNDLDAWLRLGGDGEVIGEFEGSYRDRRFGLQQLSPYFSQDLRSFSGSASASYTPSARFQMETAVAVDDSLRVLATGESGVDAERNRISSVTPRIGAILEWPRFRVELSGSYDGTFYNGLDLGATSDLDLTLGLEAVPLDGLTLGATASTWYRLKDGVAFPAGGYLSYRGDPRWTLDLFGGYRIDTNDPVTFWNDYPLTEVEAGTTLDRRHLPPDEVYYAGGGIGIVIVPEVLEFESTLERRFHRERLVPDDFDETDQFYPFRLDRFRELESDNGLVFSFGRSVRLDVGWTGHWEDRLPGTAAQQIDAGVSGEAGDLSVEVRGSAPVTAEEGVLPMVNVDIRYDIARDVEFRVYALDLLAPGIDEGRSLRGILPDEDDPFIGTGLEVGAAVRVSF
ncbi:MAG: hypothetical protein ACLFR8_06430 [Alkalispirochaeta sp.]